MADSIIYPRYLKVDTSQTYIINTKLIQHFWASLDIAYSGFRSNGKKSACNAGDSGSISWRRQWLLTPVFMLGEFHGQRRLAGYSPWVAESDMTQWLTLLLSFIEFFSSVAQSCPTLCIPVDCSMLGFLAHHQLLEHTQIHVHWVGDAIQPSHPLSPASPPTCNLSQHQGLFKWVSSSHQVAKVLEFQLQHQSFQWIFRTDFLWDSLAGSPF